MQPQLTAYTFDSLKCMHTHTHAYFAPCFLIWVRYYVGDWVIPFHPGLGGGDLISEHLAIALISIFE